jgi:hypothetical protein
LEDFREMLISLLMAQLQQLTVRLTAPQLAELEREAKRLGLTVPELVRRIVDQWREQRPAQGRKSPATSKDD